MLFSSISFLYYFLPVFFAVYTIAPGKAKNTVILLGSLVFYGCAEPKNLILILLSILIGYLGGLLIHREKSSRNRDFPQRLWLFLSSAILLSFLGYFKYADFFIENFNHLTGLSVPLQRVVLPIGISFYTFQILSYLIDLYRGDGEVQKNLIDFGAYIVFFPQLIAGPIVRCRDIAESLRHRTHTGSAVYTGIRRFLTGLGKKILLANSLAQLCDIFRASQEKSVLFYWIYAAAFTLFIYFDFSGYSDMAIGLGRIMGFSFPENFNYPYLSSSITEFWRRWHITLGSWFRDYVYIPLGGSRVGRSRWLFNISVVWMLTGLWHGAAWNFVIWGLLSALLLAVEKSTGFPEKIPRVFSHLYVLFTLMISFVIFNASHLTQAGEDILGLFGFPGLPLLTAETLYYLKSYLFVLLLAGIGCTGLPKRLFDKASHRVPRLAAVSGLAGLIAILLLSTAYLVDGSFNPFLYFRF